MSLRLVAMMFYVPVAMLLALKRPLWGIYGLMAMYYFRPDIWGAPGWWQPILWISCCAIIGWAVQAKDIRMTPGLIVSILLVLTMVVSAFTAWENSEVASDATVVIIKLVAIQFLLVQLLRTRQEFHEFLWANVIGNIWTLKSVCVLTASGGDGSRVNVGSAQGGGANYLAMVFIMALPLLYYRFVNGVKWERKLSAVLMPLHLLAIIGTGSRGGFLTLFCIFIFLAVRTNRKLTGFLTLIVVMGLIVVLMPEAKWKRFKTTFHGKEERGFAAQSRIDLWQAGIKMFKQSPITGVGHDNFPLLSARYVGYFAGDTPIRYDPTKDGVPGFSGFVAHSTWIQSLADAGLLGSVPFFGLFVMSFYTLYRVRRLKVDPHERADLNEKSQIIEGSMWAFVLASSFGSHFKIDFLWWYFGCISALGIYADKLAADWRYRQHVAKVEYEEYLRNLQDEAARV